MAEYKAKLAYLRMAPRKTRLVADLVRGEYAHTARQQLTFSQKRAAKPLLKLLNSAIANAKNINEEVDEHNLYIQKLFVDEGPKLKRYMPIARGGVHEIQKKTSHITLVLSETKQRANSKSPIANSKLENKKAKAKVKQ